MGIQVCEKDRRLESPPAEHTHTHTHITISTFPTNRSSLPSLLKNLLVLFECRPPKSYSFNRIFAHDFMTTGGPPNFDFGTAGGAVAGAFQQRLPRSWLGLGDSTICDAPIELEVSAAGRHILRVVEGLLISNLKHGDGH